jgi:hypothetical protein
LVLAHFPWCARIADELITANPPRGGSPLEPFTTYLLGCHAAGMTDTRAMFADLRARLPRNPAYAATIHDRDPR